MIVVATDREYLLAKQRFQDEEILQTGVGGANVVNALKDIPRNTPILNFGYVGSKSIPKESEVNIGSCSTYHPNVDFEDVLFSLDGDVHCFTSTDFVTEAEEKNVVFDMELAFICALGFKNVRSIKIVSDNLNLAEYEQTTR
jgi:hypothetical protein